MLILYLTDGLGQPNRDSLAQIADFLLPTEGIDTVIVFGPRRGKIILSARTTDESIHLGRKRLVSYGFRRRIYLEIRFRAATIDLFGHKGRRRIIVNERRVGLRLMRLR